MRLLRSRIFLSLVPCVLSLWNVCAFAQTFPSKPVRLIIPFGAGGPSDFLARSVGQKLGETWGQQVLMDNRGGANGVVGCELAAKSPPDGYTLVVGTNGTHGMNASLFQKLPFDTVKDFAPITRMGFAPYLLIAHPSLPARNAKELIALARSKPGAITWSAGGSPSQLGSELFKRVAKVDMVVVPYKGNAPAVTAVISGEVSVAFGSITQSAPQVRAGRLRALGVASNRRTPILPEVPTVGESGLPGFEVGAWYGLLAPAATPRPIIEKIHADAVRILREPQVQQRLAAEAFEIPADTPEQFAAVIKAEIAKWGPIVRDAKIQAD